MDLPPAEGLWNTTDYLKHVGGWDEEVVDIVRRFIEFGTKRQADGTAEINERLLEDRKHMGVRQTWEYFQATHASLIAYLESLPEHIFDLESYTGYWIGRLVPQHYKDHKDDIQTGMDRV